MCAADVYACRYIINANNSIGNKGTIVTAIVVAILLLAAVATAFVYRAKAKKEGDRAYNFEQNLKTVHKEQLAVRAEVRADELRGHTEAHNPSGDNANDGTSSNGVRGTYPPPLPPLPPPRLNEIKREDLLKVGVLGSGNFGEVWECTLHGDVVAAKIVRINENKVAHLSPLEKSAKLYKENISLGNEATVMMALGDHPHVVELIGVVRKKGPLMVVLKSEDGGDLKKVLTNVAAERLQKGTPVDFVEKNRWVHEIADGMKHIAGKHIVHRDLAARNVMVSSSGSCKIADFGLARVMKTKRKQRGADDDEIYESYYRAHSSYFPVRWTAPEGVKDNRFSSSSDVWSFAIVVVEIWQDGRKPYPDKNNRAVRSALELDPNFMHPNVGCNDHLYRLMQDCWSQVPEQRPSFAQILQRLREADGVLNGDSGATDSSELLDEDGYAKPAAAIARETRDAAGAAGGGAGVGSVSGGPEYERIDAGIDANGGDSVMPVRRPIVQTLTTTTYVESPVYEFGSRDADALMQNVTI